MLDAGITTLTIHGLRRSFSLLGEAAGAPAGAVAQVMGHKLSTQTYKNIYTLTMKDVEFRGSSLSDLRDFPQTAMRDVGHQLDKVQHGLAPDDAKPMPTIGAGVMELRIWDEAGTFRVVPDIELARKRFKELVKEISK